jgi:hypothetical protein
MSGPILVPTYPYFGRPNWRCTGCGVNYGHPHHVPGSDDCLEARRERDESRST